MRVVLRCDATTGGGIGHLVRCVAIAEAAASRGHTPVVVGAIETPLARRMCEERGIRIVDIGRPGTLDDAARQLVEWADAESADVVHVDSYELTVDLIDLAAGRRWLASSMEDGAFGRRAAHIVVDPSPDADSGLRPDDGSSVLTGLRYVPVRAAIADAPPWHGRHLPPRVLVMMGGTDAHSVGERSAQALREHADGTEVHLLIPSRSGSGPGPEGVVVHLPSDAIAPLVSGMDLVVTASGTTIWELCALGVPMAVVEVTANQAGNHQFIVGSGAAVSGGTGEAVGDADAVRISSLLTDGPALNAMSARGRELVDGRGAARIVREWERMAALPSRMPGGLRLRDATMADSRRLFDWRNAPDVRAVSVTTEELDWDSHLGWLERGLASTERFMLIVELSPLPIGHIRFDRIDQDAWEVSIVIDPDRPRHRRGRRGTRRR